MNQTQSIIILLMLTALAFFPLALQWARDRDNAPQPADPPPVDPTAVEGIMTPRQAVARHLYGQAVGWAPDAMLDYDLGNAELEATWLAEADRRL